MLPSSPGWIDLAHQGDGSRHLILWKGTQHSSPLAHMKMTNLLNTFHSMGGWTSVCAGMAHRNWQLDDDHDT